MTTLMLRANRAPRTPTTKMARRSGARPQSANHAKTTRAAMDRLPPKRSTYDAGVQASSRTDPPLGRTPPRWGRRLAAGEVGAVAGAPAALYVLAWAIVIAAGSIGVGMFLTHVATHDAFG